jgi:hypothetical protein
MLSMKKLYCLTFTLICSSTPLFSIQQKDGVVNQIEYKQQLESYKSPRYGYSLKIPQGFKTTVANGSNIDLKLINNIGNSILVNVTTRLSQEYAITAHDYSAKMLNDMIKPSNPNFNIVKSEKIYIDGEKAFMIYYTDSSMGIKAIECYLYFRDQAYVITTTAKMDKFMQYENLFWTTINSLKLKK